MNETLFHAFPDGVLRCTESVGVLHDHKALEPARRGVFGPYRRLIECGSPVGLKIPDDELSFNPCCDARSSVLRAVRL